jgi:hypothetical protein
MARTWNIPDGVISVGDYPIFEFVATDCESFLNALSPLSGLGRDHELGELIYRGQADSTWPLTPRSRREWPLPMAFSRSDNRLPDRIFAEVNAMIAFADAADRQGLSLPDHARTRARLHEFRNWLEWESWGNFLPWPHDDIVPAIGVAQHNGLPTCLLDFTSDPYVAAFFAARSALAEKNSGRLCVWIIDGYQSLGRLGEKHNVRRFVPASSTNPSLRAQ